MLKKILTRVLVLLLVLLFSLPSISGAENASVDLEQQLGIDIESADAEVLKLLIETIDSQIALQLKPFDELRQKCLEQLLHIGELEWVKQYTNLDSTNLLSMNYGQLVELKNKINLAIWQSEEWQEVTVPQGTWKVGEDIPAGHWTVKAHESTWATQISWGERLDENNEDISYGGRYSKYNTVYNPNNETFDPINDISEYSFEVQDGDYIQITYGAAVFMPYVGKPSFQFK